MTMARIGLMFLMAALQSQATTRTLHGQAVYAADAALPAGATFQATLQDVSRADAPAVVIGTTSIAEPGPSPVVFTIAYDAETVVDRRRYVVRAQIQLDGRPLYVSDTATPAFAGAASTTVSVAMRPVGAAGTVIAASQTPAPEPTTLEGTEWTAVELYGTAVVASRAPNAPHVVFGAAGRLSGADGCNRVIGSYAEKANGITFGTIAGTQMACPQTNAVATRFRDALKGTSHWSVVRGRLELYGATGKPLAVFERRASAAPDAAARLDGTRWRLVQFRGGDDRTLTPDDPAKYTIEFAPGGRLLTRVDCNRGRGTWRVTPPSQLELGPLVLTRAACPAGSLHDQIVRQWTNVRSFVRRNGHLFLSLMADGGTYEFEPLVEKP